MGIFTKNQKVTPSELDNKEGLQEEQVVEPKKPKQSGGVDLTIEEFEYLFSLIKN